MLALSAAGTAVAAVAATLAAAAGAAAGLCLYGHGLPEDGARSAP